MSSPSEIQRRARSIYEAHAEMVREKNRCLGYISDSTTWWKSNSGHVLRNQYNQVEADITRLTNRMGSLENSTSRLSSNVQRADDERRRRAEEQRRLALEAVKK